MAYADQEMSGNRIIAIIIVGLIHVLIGWLLISGLAISTVKEVMKTVTTVDIEEPEEEEPEPEPDEPEPEPEPQPVPQEPPPFVPPPPIDVPRVAPPQKSSEVMAKDTDPIVFAPPPKQGPKVEAPPAPSQARGASPDGQGRWGARIQENYPSRAIRREIEGNVGVSVTIDARGRVSDCRVSNSSGSDILDEAACDGMRRYARYNPALDDAGNPTTGSATMTIQYQLD